MSEKRGPVSPRIGETGVSKARRAKRVPAVVGYAVALVAFTAYVLLDAFVIPRSYATVEPVSAGAASSGSRAAGHHRRKGRSPSTGTSDEVATRQDGDDASGPAADAGASYRDDATSIRLSTTRYEDTDVYVVDIETDDQKALLSGLAHDTYGKNVTATVSEMAEAAGAVVAINGDFYGARNDGYVVRNGMLYRDVSAGAGQEDLVVWSDGSLEVVREGDVSARALVDAGAWQVYSFGPGLVSGDEIVVDEDDEVGRAMASNPRTAIAQLGEGHYALVVSDGRTDASEGLTLLELATFLRDELGARCAYNLDGGGSSTLWFQGKVVNTPTTNGHGAQERSVSDIVYLVR